MLDLDALQSAALARLKHSVGTSAGMHKRQLRLMAGRMREEGERPRFILVRTPAQYVRPALLGFVEGETPAINLAAGEI